MPFGIEVAVAETGKKGRKYRVENDLTGKETFGEILAFNKRLTFSIARDVLKEEQGKGFEKNPRIRTDNIFGRDDRLVKPFGKIEYFAKVDVGPAILDIYQELERRSPLVTGQFIKGNYLYYNGAIVAKSFSQVKTFVESITGKGGFKPNDEIRVVNVNPYARRLEYKGVRRGTAGQGKGKNQGKGSRKVKRKADGATLLRPNGSYYLTFRLVRRKYKSIANVMRFTFIPGGSNGINIPKLPGFRTTFSSASGKGRAGRSYLYPSIMFKLSGEGIKGEFNIE